MRVPENMRQIRQEDGYETRWVVVGPLGAIDFHCSNVHAFDAFPALRSLSRIGGLEVHRREPDTSYQKPEPDHEHCPFLGGKCWHDGSSLWASEHWIPLLEQCGEEAIWPALHAEYRRRFHVGAEDEDDCREAQDNTPSLGPFTS